MGVDIARFCMFRIPDFVICHILNLFQSDQRVQYGTLGNGRLRRVYRCCRRLWWATISSIDGVPRPKVCLKRIEALENRMADNSIESRLQALETIVTDNKNTLKEEIEAL